MSSFNKTPIEMLSNNMTMIEGARGTSKVRIGVVAAFKDVSFVKEVCV